MQFRAKCAATVAFNDGESVMVLLRLDYDKPGHLAGKLPKELGDCKTHVCEGENR
jgi:hypothetical protein